jgi:undecaprenyl-phosphate galactose phosphotransferase/putative colanic acid biosynthesis UDP-glucose lipid carrier transferase
MGHMTDTELEFGASALLPEIESESRRFVSHKSLGFAVAALEASMIVFGSGFGPLIYGRAAGYGNSVFDGSLSAGIFASALYIAIALSSRLYTLPVLIEPGRHLRRISSACCVSLLSLTAMLFLLKTGSVLSRGAILAFAAVMFIACCLTRIGAAGIISKLNSRNLISGRPVFVIGEREELLFLTSSFLFLQFGLQEVGRASLDTSTNHPDGYASLTSAMTLVRKSSAKEILIASKFDDLQHLASVEKALRASPLPARLLPNHVFRSVIERFESGKDARYNLIELQRAPLAATEQLLKRSIDICIAAAALVVLSPLLLLVAVAIKLDSSGPIIFRQRRNGYNRHPFRICKFRTMNVLEDGETVSQACRGDRRVTRIGSLLRRSSIDELPQLWNVLKGDMSLVGPRPHALAHDKTYEAIIGDYSLRHHVKPGITGWAQVNGFRGETSRVEQMEARVDLDIWYVNNWSVRLDLQILLRTAFEVMKQTAY